MPRKQYSTEQIITKLRQAEVELGRGLTTTQVCKTLGISEQTFEPKARVRHRIANRSGDFLRERIGRGRDFAEERFFDLQKRLREIGRGGG